MKARPIRALAWAVAGLAMILAPARPQNTEGAGTPPATTQPTSGSEAGSTVGTTSAESGEAPEGQFFESIDVNVVNVDVYVTDKHGKRIKGLKKDDFELFEDRKPVKISNFYTVEGGHPTADEKAAAATPAPGASPTAAPPPPAMTPQEGDLPEDQRLHLVVYIDNWNIKPFDRNRVFIGIRNFLRTQLSPGDRVMLMTYDRSPHIRRPFTADTASIASALFEIEKISANGPRLDSDRREILNVIQNSQDMNSAYARVRSYVESLHNDLDFSINSIRDLVDSLAGLPGRKAILYVSDGLEIVPGEDAFHALQEKYPQATSVILDAHQYDLSARFRELISAANADRISFYTLDAGGLRISSAASAEDREPGASSFIDSVYWSNLQQSIQMMADRTGGISIVNTNNPAVGLTRIAGDFKNYYSLGYSPAHAGDGRYHKIEVKTKRKDLVVRFRDGYRDKSIESRMSDGVMAALTYDVADNPLGLIVDRGREVPRDDGYFTVPFSIHIPIGKLVLIPQGKQQVARIRLFFAAMDEKGGVSDVQQARVPIEVPDDKLQDALGKTWRYDVPLMMRKGPQRIAVGMRDELGQVSSFVVKSIQVGG